MSVLDYILIKYVYTITTKIQFFNGESVNNGLVPTLFSPYIKGVKTVGRAEKRRSRRKKKINGSP